MHEATLLSLNDAPRNYSLLCRQSQQNSSPVVLPVIRVDEHQAQHEESQDSVDLEDPRKIAWVDASSIPSSSVAKTYSDISTPCDSVRPFTPLSSNKDDLLSMLSVDALLNMECQSLPSAHRGHRRGSYNRPPSVSLSSI